MYVTLLSGSSHGDGNKLPTTKRAGSFPCKVWCELRTGETNDKVMRMEVVRNGFQAASVFGRHEAAIEDERIPVPEKKGGRLCVSVRAMHTGWCNNNRSVEIKA